MKNQSVRKLAVAGMIGAAYAVMAIFGSVFGLTFGPIQFRFSEALCLTPFLFPEAVGGLLAFEQTGFTKAFMAAFWYNACSLAVSEAVVCYVLGLLLLKALEKTKYFRELQKKD